MSNEGFFSKHKIEIAIGIISSAAFSFLMWLVNQLASTGPNIVRYFGNYPYRQAAYTQTHSFDIDIIMISVVSVFSISVATIFPALKLRKRLEKQERILNGILVPESKTEESPDTAKSSFDSLKRELEEARVRINRLVGSSIAIIIYSSFMVIAVTYTFIFPLYLSDTFERHIIMITPYTTSEQIDMLKSDWVRMTTKADFEAIDKQVMQIVEEYGLKN